MANLLASAKQLAKAAQANRKVDLPAGVGGLWQLIGFTPRAAQLEVLSHTKRFETLVCHRRFGKTVVLLAKLIARAIYCPFPMGSYGYIAPTYDQAKRIAWSYLLRMTDKIPGRVVNVADLAITLPTYAGDTATIRLFGIDSPKQRLRGAYFDGVVFDEYADCPPNQWGTVVRPMLSDDVRRGHDIHGFPNQWAEFSGTVAGLDHFFEMYNMARMWAAGLPVMMEDPENPAKQVRVVDPDWRATIYKASETGIISKEELASALREAIKGEGRHAFMREYECDFHAAAPGSVYGDHIAMLREGGRFITGTINPNIAVNTAWDLGWDDATAIWLFQQIGNLVYLVGYMEMRHTSIPKIVHELDVASGQGRLFRFGYHLLPPDVEITELGSGKSRRAILAENGVRVTAVRQHDPVEGIAAARNLFQRLFVYEAECAEGIRALSLYKRTIDSRLGVQSEKPVHDKYSHGADAFRTLAMGIRPAHEGNDPNLAERAEF